MENLCPQTPPPNFHNSLHAPPVFPNLPNPLLTTTYFSWAPKKVAWGPKFWTKEPEELLEISLY